MECPTCKQENDPDAIYCNHCGTTLGSGQVLPSPTKGRFRLIFGLAILAISVILIGWMIVKDIKSGKPAYSTKDGQFKDQVIKENALGWQKSRQKKP